MADILISEFLDEAALELVPGRHSLHYDPALVDKPGELVARAAEAVALVVRNRTQVDAALLAAAPKLKVVGRLGVGLDNIDVEACRRRGIVVCPATGANDVAVAEYVICTAMMLRRRAYRASERVAAGAWPRNALIGGEVAGATLGLIGFGSIARHVARRAAALDMKVVAHDPFVPASDPVWERAGVVRFGLDELVAAADIVSLHVPLTADTRGLFGAGRLARMQPSAILINAARGGIVDEEALAVALSEGRLAGAALDVFDSEPLGGPAAARLADVPNLILTPHIGGVTEEANVRVSKVTIENVLRVIA